MRFLNSEVVAREGLTKLPMRWGNIIRSRGMTVAACDSKRKRLTHKKSIRLPVLSLVTTHGHPPDVAAFNAHSLDITSTTHVAYKYQVEVAEAVDCESYTFSLSTRYPAHRIQILLVLINTPASLLITTSLFTSYNLQPDIFSFPVYL